MKTNIVFILDRSGSMESLVSDVIGGFNSFVSEQKKLKDKATLTTVLFDDYYEILHDGIDIQEVRPITSKEYYVRGCTALLDAIGKTITEVYRNTKKKDKVIFVIQTDGYENASKEYTNSKVKEMVKERQKKDNWKFIFLGADLDAFATGGNLGITMTVSYPKTDLGYTACYNAISSTISDYRGKGSSAGVIDGKHFTNNCMFDSSFADTDNSYKTSDTVPLTKK